MQPAVLKANPGAEFDTPEQCWILELSNSAADPQLSIARARVAPGVTTHWHRLRGIAERYVIVEGTGRVEVADLAPREHHEREPPGVDAHQFRGLEVDRAGTHRAAPGRGPCSARRGSRG